jgi:hypothetical protein
MAPLLHYVFMEWYLIKQWMSSFTGPEREADHSPPSSSEVKNAWSISPLPQYAFMMWCSVKAQGQLYFYLTRWRIFLKFYVRHRNVVMDWSPVLCLYSRLQYYFQNIRSFIFLPCSWMAISSIARIPGLKVKVKLSLCLNWAPHHEGLLGSGAIAPFILLPRH